MISGSLLNFGNSHRLPIIHQNEAAECGLACLAMIASFHGHQVDLNSLRRKHPVSMLGVSLRGLIQVAANLNIACRPLRFEMSSLQEIKLPAILHWDMNHFVVLKSISKKQIVLHDPTCGRVVMSLESAADHLTGVALELLPTASFQKQKLTERLPLRSFWTRASGLEHTIAELFLLSLTLELVFVAAPFYMQITVDEVITRGDYDLLQVLAVGFGLLLLVRLVLSVLRSRILLILQNSLHYQIGARLFRHLLRLPVSFFDKRHTGDVLSRFGSIEPIRSILAEGLIGAVLDGIMVVLAFAMIVWYSQLLAMIVFVSFLLCAFIRFSLFSSFRVMSDDLIRAKAKETSNFVETLRAIQSLKIYNKEVERESQWLNRFADTVNCNLRLGNAKIKFTVIDDAVFGIENLLTIYVAANLVLANQLSIGMVFAFMSYKHQFVEKSLLLVEKGLDIAVIRLHLSRIADIAMADTEAGHDTYKPHDRSFAGELEFRNVYYRYSETDSYVLEDISFKIDVGKFVTIMGSSGSGKTTLMKMMLGLLEPTKGEIFIDGAPLRKVGVRAFRDQVGAVMQDDTLISGTVADNICFFDHVFDYDKMFVASQAAGIHDEIMEMPMSYNSLIGDMGSSLSGGQKQRVLLARALYRSPKYLFLDEGTAHLDVENERLVNASLRQLNMTRVSIAHRPDIVSGADEIIVVERGRIVDVKLIQRLDHV